MIKAGILGATGYAGAELARLLSAHPFAEIEILTSAHNAGAAYGDIYENFRHTGRVCEADDIEEAARRCDVVFISLPHGIASKRVTADILAKTRIIDLGADFRLKDIGVYEKWYGVEHFGAGLIAEAVYGLSEIHRADIRGARLIANPGCFTTAGILALYPLVKDRIIDIDTIIIDAKSGVSGAGRGLKPELLFCEADETVKPYGVTTHRHTPEIEEQLTLAYNNQDGGARSRAGDRSIILNFIPHLVPMNRGILSTCYAMPAEKGVTYEDVRAVYAKYYADEYFIRLTKKGVFPETRWTKGGNFIDIGFTVDERTNRVVIAAALDNLVKGAAGQAVQNMNIMFGLNERAGLETPPAFPI